MLTTMSCWFELISQGHFLLITRHRTQQLNEANLEIRVNILRTDSSLRW